MKRGMSQKLQRLLFAYEALIAYSPRPTECDWRTIPIFQTLGKNTLNLTDDKHSDPFAWAEKAIEHAGNKKTLVLIPGRTFDVYGTRHGSGGGWFDRFLSHVPKEWLRVGIACQSQVFSAHLHKKSWDESVDWLLVQKGNVWYEVETLARNMREA